MKDLRKDADIEVRMRQKDLRRLTQAARTVSRQREEIVKPSTLARELINAGVDRIIAESEQTQSLEPAGAP